MTIVWSTSCTSYHISTVSNSYTIADSYMELTRNMKNDFQKGIRIDHCYKL